MRIYINKIILILYAASLLVIVSACDNGSNTIFDENWEPDRSDPVIEDIDPPGKALAGVRSIRILGENFSSNPDEVLVYFNSVKGTVLESDENIIIVRPANVVADSVQIRVVVHGAEKFDTYIYALEPAVMTQPGIEGTDEPWAMTTGPDGTIYFSNAFDGTPQGTERIAPDGTRSMFVSRTTWRYQSMRYGPDGAIYTLRPGAGSLINRIAPDGSGDPPWAMVARMDGLDFDADGYLWTAGRNQGTDDAALFRVDQDAEVERYPFNVNVGAVRVHEGYIYAAGTRETSMDQDELIGVWRFPIEAGNIPGQPELYFNWTENVGENTVIRALEFAENGTMFIGTTGPKAMVEVTPDGTWDHFYADVVQPNIYAFSWLPESSVLMVTIEANDEFGTTQTLIRVNTGLMGAGYNAWQ